MPSTVPRSKPLTRKAIKAKVKPEVVREAPKLVSYHLDGWRFGYQIEVKGASAVIQPIGAIGAAIPRTIRVPLEDVKEAM